MFSRKYTLLLSIALLCAFFTEIQAAKVLKVSGEVMILESGASDYVVLKRRDIIKPGSVIKTGPNAKAYISPFLGIVTIVGPGSEVTIEKLQADSTKGADGSVKEKCAVELKLKSGQLLTDIVKKKNRRTEFIINTPAGAAAARGTLLLVTTEIVNVIEGSVTMTPIGGGPSQTIGRSSVCYVNSSGTLSTNASMGDFPEAIKETIISNADFSLSAVAELAVDFPETGNESLEGAVQSVSEIIVSMSELNGVDPALELETVTSELMSDITQAAIDANQDVVAVLDVAVGGVMQGLSNVTEPAAFVELLDSASKGIGNGVGGQLIANGMEQIVTDVAQSIAKSAMGAANAGANGIEGATNAATIAMIESAVGSAVSGFTEGVVIVAIEADVDVSSVTGMIDDGVQAGVAEAAADLSIDAGAIMDAATEASESATEVAVEASEDATTEAPSLPPINIDPIEDVDPQTSP